MALTEFQRDVCRRLGQNRISAGEAYLAGGATLNELFAAPRISRDVDLFHDSEEAVAATWDADRLLLETSGFSVTAPAGLNVSAETCAVENSNKVCGKPVESVPHVSHGGAVLRPDAVHRDLILHAQPKPNACRFRHLEHRAHRPETFADGRGLSDFVRVLLEEPLDRVHDLDAAGAGKPSPCRSPPVGVEFHVPERWVGLTEVGEELRHIIHGDRRLGGAMGAVRPDAQGIGPGLESDGMREHAKRNSVNPGLPRPAFV